MEVELDVSRDELRFWACLAMKENRRVEKFHWNKQIFFGGGSVFE